MLARPARGRFLAVTLVSLTLLLSACLGGTSDPVGDRAKDFTVVDVDGVAHNLTDYRGRVLVVDFFATWCGPCSDQLLELKELRGDLDEGQVAFLTIDIDDQESEGLVASYRDARDITWPVAPHGRKVGEDYNVEAIPTTVVIDGDGVIRFYHTGVVRADKLKDVIEDLL